MNTKESRSANVKIRLTPTENRIIYDTAEEKGISVSDLLRHAFFDQESSSPYAIAIRHNLMKNEMMNRIQSIDIPKSVKTKLIKEMNTIG